MSEYHCTLRYYLSDWTVEHWAMPIQLTAHVCNAGTIQGWGLFRSTWVRHSVWEQFKGRTNSRKYSTPYQARNMNVPYSGKFLSHTGSYQLWTNLLRIHNLISATLMLILMFAFSEDGCQLKVLGQLWVYWDNYGHVESVICAYYQNALACRTLTIWPRTIAEVPLLCYARFSKCHSTSLRCACGVYAPS